MNLPRAKSPTQERKRIIEKILISNVLDSMLPCPSRCRPGQALERAMKNHEIREMVGELKSDDLSDIVLDECTKIDIEYRRLLKEHPEDPNIAKKYMDSFLAK